MTPRLDVVLMQEALRDIRHMLAENSDNEEEHQAIMNAEPEELVELVFEIIKELDALRAASRALENELDVWGDARRL